MATIRVEGEEVELLTPTQVWQLYAISQLRKLLPLYEQTRDPAVFEQIHYYTSQLPMEDEIPMENLWHRFQMYLLIELVYNLWRDRHDFLAGGNNFIYYSLEQAEGIVRKQRDTYRGPDFFLVTGIDPHKPREAWVVWEEGGKFPDLIVEFLSISTAEEDKGRKREIYEKVFRTREYVMYDPFNDEIIGLRLEGDEYQPIPADERGWIWSEVLGAWMGQWEGEYYRHRFKWLRLYYPDGSLVLTTAEERALEQQRAEQERQRAEQERQRAEQLQSEVERLKARLRAMGIED